MEPVVSSGAPKAQSGEAASLLISNGNALGARHSSFPPTHRG